MTLLYLLLLCLMSYTAVSMDTKVVTTKTGKVQGVVEPSRISGKYVQKFSNIPYAEAPVGKLRFAKPQPKKSWNGILKTSNVSIACWHNDIFNLDSFPTETNVTMNEDCLILNIWTPYPQKENQSVMIWIYGGGFACGLSGTYAGHNFVALGDVVLVTINYRLSALGFLRTADGRIKGNFGFFDQRLAMKWVKENIASFGGNPQSITIFGWSAGAASVSAHTLSSGSWSYFNRAIMQSGVINAPWATPTKNDGHALSVFLDAVNCTDNGELLECLRNNVTGDDVKYIYTRKRLEANPWYKPAVDGDFFTEETEALLEKGAFKNGNVLIGITKDESYYFIPQFLQPGENPDAFLEKHIKTTLSNHPDDVIEQAIKLYRPNNGFQSKREALRAIVDFDTDFNNWAVNRDAIIYSQGTASSNVYFYRYSHVSEILTPALYSANHTFGFATHGVDIVSVFGVPINNSTYPSEDQILSMRMILYWTNFAKYGNPNKGITTLPLVLDGINNLPEWPEFTNATREYLEIESNSRMVVRKRLREKYYEFLEDPEGFIRRNKTPSVASKYKVPAMMLVLSVLPALQFIL